MTDGTSQNAVDLLPISEGPLKSKYQTEALELQTVQEHSLSVQDQIVEESARLLKLKKELESLRNKNLEIEKLIKVQKAKSTLRGVNLCGTTSEAPGSPDERHSMFVPGMSLRSNRSHSRNSSISGIPKLNLGKKRSDKFDMRKDLVDARIRKIERHNRHPSNIKPTRSAELNATYSTSGVSTGSDTNDISKPSVRNKVRKILNTVPKSRHENSLSYLADVFHSVGISFKDHEEKTASKDLMKKFCRHARSELFRARARVFSQGDAAEEFFVVLVGSVEVLVKDVVTKKDKVATVLKPGAMFGELGLMHDTARTATVVAVEETELVVLDKKDYLRIFNDAEDEFANHALMTDEAGQPLTWEQRVDKAVMFIEDAMHQRDLTHVRINSLSIRINKVLNSVTYSTIRLVIISVQLSFVCFEPPSFQDRKRREFEDWRVGLLAAEWFVVVFWLFDLVMRLYRSSWKMFFFRSSSCWGYGSKPEWNHICLFILTSLNLVDVSLSTFSGDMTFRMFRLLRPLLLVVHFTSVRKFYRICIHIFIQGKEFFFMILLCQLLFGAVGMTLFANDYHEEAFLEGLSPYQYLDPSSCSAGDCELPSWVFSAFGSFWQTQITLVVLLTTENYPEVLWPPLAVNRWSAIYFIAYLLLAYFFLLNIVLAIMFQNYNTAYLHILHEEEVSERKALTNAWDLLNKSGQVALPIDTIENVIQKVRPDYNTAQVIILVNILDQDKNNLIEFEEWGELVDRLFEEIHNGESTWFHEVFTKKALVSMFPSLAPKSMREKYGRFATVKIISAAIKDIDFGDYILRCVELTDVIILLAWRDIESFYAINLICCAIIFINEGLNLLSSRNGLLIALYSYKNHFLLVLTEMIGVIIGYADRDSKLQVLRFAGIFKLSPLCVWVSKKWELLVSKFSSFDTFYGDDSEEMEMIDKQNDMTIASLFHVLLSLSKIFLLFFCSVFFVLIYIWMILGMELFNGNGAANRCSTTGQMANEPDARFCDGLSTVLVLFQILTTNDWHHVMYNTVEKYGGGAALYFILYVILVPMVMVFLLIAYVWDFYFEEFKKVKLEEESQGNLLQPNDSFGFADRSSGNPDDISNLDHFKSDLSSLNPAEVAEKEQIDFLKFRVQKPRGIAYMKRQIGRTKKTEENLKREKTAILENNFSLGSRDKSLRGSDRSPKTEKKFENWSTQKSSGVVEGRKHRVQSEKLTRNIPLSNNNSQRASNVK